MEYLPEALPLRAFLTQRDLSLTRSDVVDILGGIASGLSRLHSRDLWHHDLHDDNIMVRPVPTDESTGERFEAKLIDFGSVLVNVTAQDEEDPRSDYFYLAKHIHSVTAAFQQHALLSGSIVNADRTFGTALHRIAHQVADSDISRRKVQPQDVADAIRDALRSCTNEHERPPFTAMLKEKGLSFEDPLDRTNALRLAPRDVATLFTDSLGWERQLRRSETVVVTGPRGCGKTMLLRHMALPSQARPREKEVAIGAVAERLKSEAFLGFLVSCSELRTPFLRSSYKRLEATKPAVAEDFCREFINIHFANDVLRSLLWLQREKLAVLSNADLAPLVARLAEMSGCHAKDADADTVLEHLERRVAALSNLREPESYTPSDMCRDDVLNLIGIALQSASWIQGKELWFLLDDYSVNRTGNLRERIS